MIVSHEGKTRGNSRLVITAAIMITPHRAILIEIAGTSPREPGRAAMRFFCRTTRHPCKRDCRQDAGLAQSRSTAPGDFARPTDQFHEII